ncbi:MAG: metallophosphoesterase [Ruminococcus sp.]|nr:metallophosphoesterase [Ruminococcus sp.]
MAKSVTTTYTIHSERLRSPLKIALIADLHERRAVDILNRLRAAQPDLIAVAGDTLERYRDDRYASTVKRRFNPLRWLIVNIIYYVNYAATMLRRERSRPSKEYAYSFLRQAADVAPVFLSLGNHETGIMPEDRDFFRENNIHCLDNEDMEFAVNSNFIVIGGLSEEYDEAWLHRFAQKDAFRLLLCHNPSYYDLMVKQTDIDLVLAGHNHGGQIRIFGKGVAGAGGRLFPKYDKGVFDDRLVVSAGCANTAAIPRINNPRELVIIELKKI